MKLVVALTTMVFLVSLVAACTTSAPAPSPTQAAASAAKPATTYKLVFAHDSAPLNARTTAGNWMVGEAAKRSNGRLVIDHQAGGVLGADPKVVEQVMAGSIDMTATWNYQLTGFVPDFEITMLPMFFGLDVKKAQDVLRAGVYGKALTQKLEAKAPVKVLDYVIHGPPGSTWNAKKFVKSPQDWSGLRIRNQSASGDAFIKSLAASPVPIPFGDIYMGAQQGTVDTMIANIGAGVGIKGQEQFKYITENGVWTWFTVFFIGKDSWNKLPPDLQPVLQQLAVDFDNNMSTTWFGDDAKLKAQIIKDNGVQFYTPTAAELDALRQATMPSQDQFLKQSKIDASLIDTVKQALK